MVALPLVEDSNCSKPMPVTNVPPVIVTEPLPELLLLPFNLIVSVPE